MVKCSTVLTNKSIKALAKYHTKKQQANIPVTVKSRIKQILLFVVCLFIFVMGILNTYGLWIKYHETESILFIISKSSLLLVSGLVLLCASVQGTKTRKLYLELKNYFSETKTKHIDYVISKNGIQMIINNESTLYRWNSIEYIEADKQFFYFTCEGKHSIIEKKCLSPEDISALEQFIQQNQIVYQEA